MPSDSTPGEDWLSYVSGPYRNTVADFVEHILAEERERCAKLCETGREAFLDGTDIHDEFEWCAAAIRASR